MKIIFITGNHPRHKYIAQKISESGHLELIISQKRESFTPDPPNDLEKDLSNLMIKHFKKRKESENLFFGEIEWPESERIEIKKTEQEDTKIVNKIQSLKPDLILTYGCGMISSQVIKSAKNAWNIHGGLSPWYKGGITLFWPSYMLEPQMTGITIHELTKDLDAGDIIHQCTSDLVRGDGVHDLACRAITKIGEEINILISMIESGDNIKKKPQISSGKLWRESDWRPEHLKLIYDTYDDKIVDNYLDKKFLQNNPLIFRQFN